MTISDERSSASIRQIYRDGFVHLPGLVICFIGTVLLTKISSLLAPFNLYFTFADLVKSGEGGYGILPFFVKMIIPFGVGSAYFYWAKDRDAAVATDSPERQRINLELTAGAGAAMGAFLLSWPAIVLWEFVVSPTIYTLRLQFFIVYVLYIISFWWIACAGVLAARLVWLQDDSHREIQSRLKAQYQFVLIIWTLVFALATGGFADWASKHFVGG